ncbi:MAG: hypothetical protein ABIO74_11980 [Dokdonella sp.]
MKYAYSFALVLTLLFAVPVAAADIAEHAINASSRDAFDTVSGWVRKQMDAGGRYSYVTADERNKVNAELDEMGQLFQQRSDVAHMSDAEKTMLFNSQEHVNAILAKRDNERLICKSEMPIGSHIPVKTCQTAGMMEARRRNDVQYLQRNQNSPQLKSGR